MWQAFVEQPELGVLTLLGGGAGILFLTQMLGKVVKTAYEKARDQLLSVATRTLCPGPRKVSCWPPCSQKSRMH